MNHLAYADDFALVANTARAIKKLLRICEWFSYDHYNVFSLSKSVCLVVPPKGCKLDSAPNVYLEGKALDYVDSSKYVRHGINSKLTDGADIKREIRSLSVRSNILQRKFAF